jgi:hypothetical protein
MDGKSGTQRQIHVIELLQFKLIFLLFPCNVYASQNHYTNGSNHLIRGHPKNYYPRGPQSNTFPGNLQPGVRRSPRLLVFPNVLCNFSNVS